MNALLLTLKGSLRSWGGTSVGDNRWTEQHPTCSALLGLAGACMGIDKHNHEQVTAWYNGFHVCTLTAVSYKHKERSGFKRNHHPIMFSDYQTAKNSLNMDGKRRPGTIVTHRGYLADALDVAAIIPIHNAAEDWLNQLKFAVQQPCFTPYLGRRSNPLSAPLTEPGEKVVTVHSTEELSELLFDRLSHQQIGEWRSSSCEFRVPRSLLMGTKVLGKNWIYSGKEMVADHRTGALRFFKNREVYKFRRREE